MTRASLALAIFALLAAPLHAATLADLEFLAGNWQGIGDGGSGEFAFKRDLGGQIMVRTNHAAYPATADRAAFTHDDLMIIYVEKGVLRADYWDTEGHQIRYVVTTAPNEATFVSAAAGTEPQYRLTYKLNTGGVLNGRFEVGGKAYREWTARR